MSPQLWLTRYFRKTNISNNQCAILIFNQKKLSIKRKYPSFLHVSPNFEDGSPFHCIHFKFTKRDPHKSIKGLQVPHVAQVLKSIMKYALKFVLLKKNWKTMVSQNLLDYLLEVGLTRIPGERETLSIVHVGLHIDFFLSMKSSLGI